MKHQKSARSFASRWGFILASVGSAVGMANVWGFPNKLGSNGGGAFLLIYLLFVFIFSYVGLPAEFAMGRRAATGTLGAYRNAWATRGEAAGKVGGVLGWLPLAGSLCIAIGYAVIVTYVLKALVDSLTGTLMTADTAAWFASFSAQPYSVVPYHIIVVVGTLLTLFLGAHSIEKTNKIMMPLFFLIFLVLAVRVFFLPGAAEGYRFMFTPRWQALTDPMIWIWAMGQAFFSLSVTGSGMIVYGAYLSPQEDVVGVAQHTALFDTIAAVVAALVIIPGLLFLRAGCRRGTQPAVCHAAHHFAGYSPRSAVCRYPVYRHDLCRGQLAAKHVRGRGGIAPEPVPPVEPHRYPHHPGRTVPWLRHRYGDHLPMGAVDGSCFHLYHPHRRYAGRCFLVLCNEKGRAAFGHQYRQREDPRPPVVWHRPVPLCSAGCYPVLRCPVYEGRVLIP